MTANEFIERLNALYPDMYEFKTLATKDPVLMRQVVTTFAIKSQLYFQLGLNKENKGRLHLLHTADYALENGSVIKDFKGDFK